MSYVQCTIEELIPFLVSRQFTIVSGIDDGWEQWHRTFENSGLRIAVDQYERDDQMFLNIEELDSVTLFYQGPREQYEMAINLLIAICDIAEQRARGSVIRLEPIGPLHGKSFDEEHRLTGAPVASTLAVDPPSLARLTAAQKDEPRAAEALAAVMREVQTVCACGHSQLVHASSTAECLHTFKGLGCDCQQFCPLDVPSPKVVPISESKICQCGHSNLEHSPACGCLHVVRSEWVSQYILNKHCECLEFKEAK